MRACSTKCVVCAKTPSLCPKYSRASDLRQNDAVAKGRSSVATRACGSDDAYKLMSIEGAGQHAGKAYAS